MSGQVIVLADYRGLQVEFTDSGWFNATAVAAKYGKRPVDWLKLPETRRYIKALARSSNVKKSHFSRTKRGNGGGTWLHPKLGVRFAQWLDIDFAVWCDEQIDALIHERRALPIGLFAQRLAFEAMKAKSEERGRIGSKLMNERRRDKPVLVLQDKQWRLTMEPGLFPALERVAA